MQKILFSALLLASAFQTAKAQSYTSGEWTYIIENGGATITSSSATGAVTIPSSVNGIPVVKVGGGYPSIFGFANTSVTSVTILNGLTTIGDYTFHTCRNLSTINFPSSLTSIGVSAFENCNSLTWVIIPTDNVTIGVNAFYGTSCTIITPSLLNALANNDAFVTAVANKIKATGGNYGIATQSGLSSAITTAVEPLATKSELTSSLAQSRTDGINSVLSNPNLWTLYTTSQIQNMAVGDLVLTRQVGGGFVLNYDIEQSNDLQNWTTYQALSLPLTGLPTDKAFVRIKAKQ